MPDSADLNKKLGIKINSIKRCMKEIEVYKLEAEKQGAKIAFLEASAACPHDIKKQKEILEETNRMLPDCEQRVATLKADLQRFLSSSSEFTPELVAEANSLI